jgi:hypothetical protein
MVTAAPGIGLGQIAVFEVAEDAPAALIHGGEAERSIDPGLSAACRLV